MIRRNKKSRMYHAPNVKVTQMALESNFCDTIRFNAQVDMLENVNANAKYKDEDGEAFYFDQF